MALQLLRSRSAVTATLAARQGQVVARRTFVATRATFVGKESALHKEDRAAEVDHHKQDQLKKQREGKGHWKDELASDSESIVKADRGETQHKGSIEELQRESAKASQKEHKEGK